MEITWKIIATHGESGRYCQLDVPDDFAPLRAFFFEVSELDYPSIIECSLKGIGSGFNFVGVIFPGDLHESDDPIDGEMVEIYDPFSSIQIPKTTFLRLLQEVAETTLRIMRECGKSTEDFDRRMLKTLFDLRLTIGVHQSSKNLHRSD